MRMCCGCRTQQSISDLIRLQICTQTHKLIPREQKQSGRSAWVCFNVQCVQSIIKHPKKLHRSLRSKPNMSKFGMTLSIWLEHRCKIILSRLSADGVLSVDDTYSTDAPIYIWSTIDHVQPLRLLKDSKQWSNYTISTQNQACGVPTVQTSKMNVRLMSSKQHKLISQLFINLEFLDALKTQ